MAHYEQMKKNIIEKGDIEEALNAANAIGDDRLQKRSSGEVVPDAFTHGTSQQRVYWFKKGLRLATWHREILLAIEISYLVSCFLTL
jgi:predicted metalloprotease